LIDNLFGKVDSNTDGLISFTEADNLRKQIQQRETAHTGTNNNSGTAQSLAEGETLSKQIPQKETANAGINNISGIGQGWKSEMFSALLKVFSTTAGSSGESTSLYT